jgi:hypothetical protein
LLTVAVTAEKGRDAGEGEDGGRPAAPPLHDCSAVAMVSDITVF